MGRLHMGYVHVVKNLVLVWISIMAIVPVSPIQPPHRKPCQVSKCGHEQHIPDLLKARVPAKNRIDCKITAKQEIRSKVVK